MCFMRAGLTEQGFLVNASWSSCSSMVYTICAYLIHPGYSVWPYQRTLNDPFKQFQSTSSHSRGSEAWASRPIKTDPSLRTKDANS